MKHSKESKRKFWEEFDQLAATVSIIPLLESRDILDFLVDKLLDFGVLQNPGNHARENGYGQYSLYFQTWLIVHRSSETGRWIRTMHKGFLLKQRYDLVHPYHSIYHNYLNFKKAS